MVSALWRGRAPTQASRIDMLLAAPSGACLTPVGT